MSITPHAPSSYSPADLRQAIIRRFLQLGLYIAVQATILFAAAGRWEWPMAWVYLGMYLGVIALLSLLILPRNPELVAERSQMKENTKSWDKVFSVVYTICGLSVLLVAGLDQRGGWSPPFPAWLMGSGVGVLMAGWALLVWAMTTNRFFSSVVRIQTDRGHTVVSSGPYQFVRHPGYVSMMVSALGAIAMFGSVWAVIPTVLLISLVIVRTALEDQTLQNELPGYKDYAARVRYRLLPGVW